MNELVTKLVAVTVLVTSCIDVDVAVAVKELVTRLVAVAVVVTD